MPLRRGSVLRATLRGGAPGVSRLAGGDVAALLDVGLKGGLSQSGLRDHEGSEAYVIWLRRTGGSK